MIKGFYVPYPGRAEPGYSRALTHEQKGLTVGKHTEITAAVFTSHHLGLQIKAIQV